MSDGGIPDFDDDPKIDTVNSLYVRQRTDLDPERKAAMEYHFDELEIKDIVQPCGYTESIKDQYHHFYQEKGDFGALIKMLELYPVYGNQEIRNVSYSQQIETFLQIKLRIMISSLLALQ